MSTHCTLSCIIRLHLKGPDIQVKKTADSQSQRLKFTKIQNGQAKKPVEQSLTGLSKIVSQLITHKQNWLSTSGKS